MIVPYISSLSEDALRAVPNHFREASFAMGASRLQTSFRVVMPAAFSGITHKNTGKDLLGCPPKKLRFLELLTDF